MRSRFAACLVSLTFAVPVVALAHDPPRPSVREPTHDHAHAGLDQKPLGTRKDLAAHAAVIRSGESMQHDEPYIAHAAPGQTGVWKFNRAGQFDFACLVPGHFEAGMTGTVVVQR